MGNRLGTVLSPPIERFMDKIIFAPSGCIEWTAGLNAGGYGQFYVGRTSLSQTGGGSAHRFAYEHFVGPIPDGMQLDHLCRNRACVNPDHLEPVTLRENLLRGVGPSAQNSKKTHCPAGHPYDKANTYIRRSGGRACRTCAHARDLRGADAVNAKHRALRAARKAA